MIQQNSQPPFNTLVWSSLKLAPVSWSISYQSVYWLQRVHSCHNDPRPLDHGTNQEKLTPIHCTTNNCTCISQNYLHVGLHCSCLYIYECVLAMGNHKAPVV